MFAALVVLATLAQPAPRVALPPDSERAAGDVPALPLERPIVLWADGEVRARAGASATWAPPVIGDALEDGHSLELATNGRVVALDGERLVVVRGAGYWRMTRGALETVTGDGPSVERLAAYREGELPTLEPTTSQPLDADLGLAATLAIVAPSGPVVRVPPTAIRWHWPHEGGRFDLTIARLETDGTTTDVERWGNLEGRQHTLWARLEAGNEYRVGIALATHGVASPAIVDARVVRVLAPSELAAVEGALAALEAVASASRRHRPEFDVLRARLLESYGLWADAQAVWVGLSLIHPERPELVHRAVRLHRRQQGL
ncbi:MAG: hypothetical protein IT385_07285 [Deltaproteobacteria bacterium]|nr:hypothetical protein [Deltaproteobacteria bacterium]